jgi:hypothetical protein
LKDWRIEGSEGFTPGSPISPFYPCCEFMVGIHVSSFLSIPFAVCNLLAFCLYLPYFQQPIGLPPGPIY